LRSNKYWFVIFVFFIANIQAANHSFPDVVKQVSQSIVAVAIDAPIKHANPKVLGTGFIIHNGQYAVTNYHVVSQVLDPSIVEHYVVLSGSGQIVKKVKAEIHSIDIKHDLALLKLDATLPAMKLSEPEMMHPGTEVAFTGFPIGAAIGLYPATHKGMISAITPDAIPAQNADQLTVSMLQRLKAPELVYQLDATAYPGNSGSPVYHVDSGEVVGVINKVFVSQGKESALSAPSGISYAIPIVHARSLMKKESL